MDAVEEVELLVTVVGHRDFRMIGEHVEERSGAALLIPRDDEMPCRVLCALLNPPVEPESLVNWTNAAWERARSRCR